MVVEHASISEHTLLESIKSYRDVCLMRSLKLTRPDIVHPALNEADGTASHVTDLALANGFSQLGKFSAEYKERFGEATSEMLNADNLQYSLAPFPSLLRCCRYGARSASRSPSSQIVLVR